MRFSTRLFVPRIVGVVGGCWHECREDRCPAGNGVMGIRRGVEAGTLVRGSSSSSRLRGVILPSV